MENNTKPDYPGGWSLSDDDCMQYVRRCNAMEFELIQYSSVSAEEPLYEVFTDIICLRDYDITEIENILKGFGYESVDDVIAAYRNMDEANQVIAECIFEHFGSHSVEPVCRGVSETEAMKAILDYMAAHGEYPPNHWKVEISVEELVKKALALDIEETLEFETQEAGHVYGIKRITPFDTDVLLLNYYQGGSPYVVELVADENSTLEASVLNRFKQYCDGEEIAAIIISTEPKEKLLCDEAQKMRDRKREALLSKGELIERLSDDGFTDRRLSDIREEYMDTLGFDPVWRYPFCHDGDLGAVLIPVQEGFLWLPYNVIDVFDNEMYNPESASLLDAETCRYIIEEMKTYMEPFAAVMEYVAEELEMQTNKKIGVD